MSWITDDAVSGVRQASDPQRVAALQRRLIGCLNPDDTVADTTIALANMIASTLGDNPYATPGKVGSGVIVFTELLLQALRAKGYDL